MDLAFVATCLNYENFNSLLLGVFLLFLSSISLSNIGFLSERRNFLFKRYLSQLSALIDLIVDTDHDIIDDWTVRVSSCHSTGHTHLLISSGSRSSVQLSHEFQEIVRAAGERT